MSGFVGLLIGATVVVFRNLAAGTIQNRADLQRIVGHRPILATIPRRPRRPRKADGTEPEWLLESRVGDSGFRFAESFRALRVNLTRLLRAPELFLRVPDDAGEKWFAEELVPASRFRESRTMTTWSRCVPRWSALPAAPLTRTAGRTAIRLMRFSSASSPISPPHLCVAATSVPRTPRMRPNVRFGRMPDAVVRQQSQSRSAGDLGALWIMPMRFDGHSVYLAQVARPTGGRFAPREAQNLVLHEDVDEGEEFADPGHDVFGRPGQARVRHRRRSRVPGTTANDVQRAHSATACVRSCSLRRGRSALSQVQMLDWEPYLDWRQSPATQGGRQCPQVTLFGRPDDSAGRLCGAAIVAQRWHGFMADDRWLPWAHRLRTRAADGLLAGTTAAGAGPCVAAGVQDKRGRFREIFCLDPPYARKRDSR